METGFRVPIPVLYGIQNWGNGYFDVNAAGHLVVKPFRTGPGVDLFEVVEELAKRRCPDAGPPALPADPRVAGADPAPGVPERHLRVPVRRRLPGGLPDEGEPPARRDRRAAPGRQQVRLRARGRNARRSSTSPLALEQPEDRLLICNGFKDDAFIEMAFWGRRPARRSSSSSSRSARSSPPASAWSSRPAGSR